MLYKYFSFFIQGIYSVSIQDFPICIKFLSLSFYIVFVNRLMFLLINVVIIGRLSEGALEKRQVRRDRDAGGSGFEGLYNTAGGR